MTCPTCSGRAYVGADACPRCYATGDEPSPASPALVAARLGVRAEALVSLSEPPGGSPAGKRSMIEEAARVRLAAIRTHAAAGPSTLRDREALVMTLRLVEAGADHQPFVKAALPHLTRFGGSTLLAHLDLAVRAAEGRTRETARRIERRIDA